MWTSIYVSMTEKKVQKIKEKMEVEGFLVRINVNKDSEFELQVPKGEAKDAYEAMSGMLASV